MQETIQQPEGGAAVRSSDLLGGVGCACVHPDGQTCARIRDGYEPDDRNYEMHKRTCECACHSEGDED